MPKKAEGSTLASERATLRITPDVNTRADALVSALSRDAAMRGFTRVTRSVVLKRALLLGLEQLEKQYARK